MPDMSKYDMWLMPIAEKYTFGVKFSLERKSIFFEIKKDNL